MGSGKGRFSGEGSGKGEGKVLSDGRGASIRRKNIRYTKKKGHVSLVTQSHCIFEGDLKKKTLGAARN